MLHRWSEGRVSEGLPGHSGHSSLKPLLQTVSTNLNNVAKFKLRSGDFYFKLKFISPIHMHSVISTYLQAPKYETLPCLDRITCGEIEEKRHSPWRPLCISWTVSARVFWEAAGRRDLDEVIMSVLTTPAILNCPFSTSSDTIMLRSSPSCLVVPITKPQNHYY